MHSSREMRVDGVCGLIFFCQAGDGIRDYDVTGVQTCALPILAAEGLFAAERKQPLPFLPRTIGVVTSPTANCIYRATAVVNTR